jgi:hypothetical protein
MVHVISEPS